MSKNKGNYTYVGDESSGITLEGVGSQMSSYLPDAGTAPGAQGHTEITFTSDRGGYCVAIHNLRTPNTTNPETIQIQARSINGGDDLAIDGVYAHGTIASYIALPGGDTIYGRFDRVSIEEPGTGINTIRMIKGGE
jgi:hypothetical protein